MAGAQPPTPSETSLIDFKAVPDANEQDA